MENIMEMPPINRTFDGKTYYIAAYGLTNVEAKNRADVIKARGDKARIVPYKGTFVVYMKGFVDINKWYMKMKKLIQKY